MGLRGPLSGEKRGPKTESQKHDAKSVEGSPTCPRTLSDVGKKKWKEITTALDQSGILSKTDAEIIYQYCLLYEKQQYCEAFLSANGLVYENKSATRRQHPEVALSLDCGKQMKLLLETMGLTPAARSRVSISDSEDHNIDPKWLDPEAN